MVSEKVTCPSCQHEFYHQCELANEMLVRNQGLERVFREIVSLAVGSMKVEPRQPRTYTKKKPAASPDDEEAP